MRVLIADHCEIVVQRLAAMLGELEGIEIVAQTDSVAETKEAVRNLKPDVLILDIALPGGSGIDVLSTIKREQMAPIVIVLTNYSYPQYRKKCLQLGARFFFDKATEFGEVAEVLRSLPRNA